MKNFSHILDALRDGIIVTNCSGEIEKLNAEACRILDISADVATGCTVDHILGDDHIAANFVHTVIETGRSTAASEQTVERRFHDNLLVQITATPLLDREGTIEGVVLVLSDQTIASSLKRTAAERERLATFGQIAAGIAHEVKNPLGGIRGAAELLGRRAEDLKSKETAALIVREADRITTLVDDLMVFARNDELKLELINLHRVLDDVLDLLSHDPISQKCEVHRNYDPSLPEFYADGARLTQVFHNLGRNALQAMAEDGGALTITTRLGIRHQISEEGKKLSLVEIEFHNTGSSISEENLKNVLTPFYTTRPQGTGLGLPLANHWASRHGGSLQICSQPDSGTHVLITLPLRRSQ